MPPPPPRAQSVSGERRPTPPRTRDALELARRSLLIMEEDQARGGDWRRRGADLQLRVGRRHAGRLLLTRRARNASGTATQCTRGKDSRARGTAARACRPPPPSERPGRMRHIYSPPPLPPPSMIGVVTRAGNGAGWVQSKQALARGVPIAHIIEALWVSTPATVTGRWRARRLNNVCCWSAACRATTPDCWWADGLTGQGSTHGGLSSPGAAARASRPATTYPPAPPPGRRPWPGVFTLNISGQEQG
jgi:hypothetical protein